VVRRVIGFTVRTYVLEFQIGEAKRRAGDGAETRV
jgi:hypothetical protein